MTLLRACSGPWHEEVAEPPDAEVDVGFGLSSVKSLGGERGERFSPSREKTPELRARS
jgi:hypothetical protein